jgi:hypothetical protein
MSIILSCQLCNTNNQLEKLSNDLFNINQACKMCSTTVVYPTGLDRPFLCIQTSSKEIKSSLLQEMFMLFEVTMLDKPRKFSYF